jgi:hypothetical protein
MSLNYTTLQSTVLAQAKREELTTEVVQFIRSCESMIRRKLMALEFRATIDETDRITVGAGVYNLPDYVQEVRAIFGTINGNRVKLRDAGLNGINALAATDQSQEYAISGHTVEFRGVPGTGSTFEAVVFGHPDPLETTATNVILDKYEDLYVFGALFFLYNWVQDRELAQDALSVFEDVVKHVNKMAQRIDGNHTSPPAYNFGQVPTGRSY